MNIILASSLGNQVAQQEKVNRGKFWNNVQSLLAVIAAAIVIRVYADIPAKYVRDHMPRLYHSLDQTKYLFLPKR